MMEMKKLEISHRQERTDKMSKSKSYLPNGGYTLTQGSNYMLDGFHFDTEYGGGPQEKARLPESKGLADLPSGMIPLDSSGVSTLPNGVETQVDLNMEEITREASQEISLVDQSWLASQAEPDLSGLIELEEVYKNLAEGHMNNDTHNKIKELEESWGQTSTTGLEIIPNENRLHDKYQNSYRDDQSKLPGDDYREQMEKNVRKLAYGQPLNLVLSEINANANDVLQMKTKLASEYGLHGQVYIKEEHFPGLFNGRWDEVINKRCATSMYIIPKNEDCAFDRFLGMEVVNTIPWNKAAKSLLPKLESYGVRIASGTAKSKLQSAFIDLIEGRVNRQSKSATWFPTQVDQSSLISLDHAKRELENARDENIFVASVEQVEQTKIEKKLNRIAEQLVSQRFLAEEQVEDVMSSNKTASAKIDRLYNLASQPVSSSSYTGQGKNASYHNMHKHMNSNAYVPQKSERELENREKNALKKISSLIQSGVITYDQIEEITKDKKTPEDKVASVFKFLTKNQKTASYNQYDVKEHRMVKRRDKQLDVVPNREKRASDSLWSDVNAKVDKLVSSGLLSQDKYNTLKSIQDPNEFVRKAFDLASKPSESNVYQGEETAHILGSKKSNVVSATEKKVATWLRQKISEGSAGEELDVLLATRFSQDVLNEYKTRIASIRAEHEGLSGHLYVDAEAYLTKGTEGCDNGALIHRANQIPTLAKTAKCGTCVFNSGGTCQKYNKSIIASTEEIVEDPVSYQKEMIRLANANDSEQTASLFVNNYDANEFSLTANQDVSVDDAPSNEKLGDILFGGFEV